MKEKWEYRQETVQMSGDHLSGRGEEMLGHLGNEGWEMVTAIPITETQKLSDSSPHTHIRALLCIFKRRMNQQ
jgi:hypothetical protein